MSGVAYNIFWATNHFFLDPLAHLVDDAVRTAREAATEAANAAWHAAEGPDSPRDPALRNAAWHFLRSNSKAAGVDILQLLSPSMRWLTAAATLFLVLCLLEAS